MYYPAKKLFDLNNTVKFDKYIALQDEIARQKQPKKHSLTGFVSNVVLNGKDNSLVFST